jgi:hypothetical protein
MQLKPAFQNYESLRRVYDSKIIEMAMEYGKYNFFLFKLYLINIFIC